MNQLVPPKFQTPSQTSDNRLPKTTPHVCLDNAYPPGPPSPARPLPCANQATEDNDLVLELERSVAEGLRQVGANAEEEVGVCRSWPSHLNNAQQHTHKQYNIHTCNAMQYSCNTITIQYVQLQYNTIHYIKLHYVTLHTYSL